jgi:hypothetical protein
MPCLLCGSTNEKEFASEMVIHVGGLANIENPGVWVFPKLVTCLDCGIVRFNISKPDLAPLVGGAPRNERRTMAAVG